MNRPRPNKGRRVVPRGQRAASAPRVIRVHTEGRVTERDYLNYWSRRNERVRIDWGESGMSPAGLVARAQQDAQVSRRSGKRYGTPAFDEIWCVFDVDAHLNVSQAIIDAEQSDIHVAVSNPCFELWLVLHCQDQRAHVERRRIQQRASQLGLVDGKSIPNADLRRLAEGYEDAKQRARELDVWHDENDSPPRSNPSSDVWRLVDRLRL